MSMPVIIGWRERADFPEWGIQRTRVKIDTGARTSSIDAIVQEIRESPDGIKLAVLGLRLWRTRPERLKFVEAPLVRRTRVRNTGTCQSERLVIEAVICLGAVTKRIELTVADRGGMLIPIILGRRALAGDFIVDVSRKYILNA